MKKRIGDEIMRLTKVMKRALACGVAASLLVTGVDVNVNTVSAKKRPKLSKSKASMIAGATTTLKVKKARKKVKWSVSNKKILKITKKSGKKKEQATIQGLKKGSAVVIAKVGKTKLKCKVKVKANKIKSVSVDKLDYSALTVKFTKKTSLNVGDVKIAVKAYKSGTYNLNPKVEALTTKDQKTYRLYLTSVVPLNAFVQVKQGKYTKEVQNKQSLLADKEEVTLLLEKEVTVNDSETLPGCFQQAVGNISYSLKKGNKLPAGLTLVGKRGVIKGIPTTAGETSVNLVAQDEAGRKANLSMLIKVYDETTIAVKDNKGDEIKLDDYMVDVGASMLATPAPSAAGSTSPEQTGVPAVQAVDNSLRTAAKAATEAATQTPAIPWTPSPVWTAGPTPTGYGNQAYDTYDITPKGGSGSYKFDLVPTGADAGVKLDTDVEDPTTHQITKQAAASAALSIPYGLAAGVHTYTINITDAADATRTTTAVVELTVVDNFNISGQVKDSVEGLLSGHERIYFYPEDAVNGSDYEIRRTYLKYQDGKLVGGNHQSGYGDKDDRDSWTRICTNGDRYEGYTHYNTSVVGPYPVPTILTAEPTPAPTATAAPAGGTPTAAPYQVADLTAGNYAAEVPAGTYTVKVEGNNGVAYELDDKVTVSADAVGAVNLTMPVRFANVSAVAKFANDKVIANDWIYFETENRQYEDWTFAVQTNYLGAFTASLPVGTYKMYWEDENGNPQYFTNDVKIEDAAADVNLGDQKLAVARYEVSGSFKIRELNYDNAEMEELAPGKRLYFFDAAGKAKTVTTKYDRNWDNASDKYVNGPNHGAFDKLLLDNGTYTVRYNDVSYYYDEDDNTYYPNASSWHTLGQITVNGADVRQDFVYNSLSAGRVAEFANAPALALEQDNALTSSGNNDLLVKVVIPAPADPNQANANVPYDFSVKLNGNQSMPTSIRLYKETGEVTDMVYGETTIWLTPGTYLMSLTPIKTDDEGTRQVVGNVNVKVSKSLKAYEKRSTAMVLNTPATLVCAKNEADDDLKYAAYAKISVEANKTYVVNYSSKTIGVNSIDLECVSGEIDRIYTSTEAEMGLGSGIYRFTAESTGDVYLKFETHDTISSSIDVTVTEQAAVQ